MIRSVSKQFLLKRPVFMRLYSKGASDSQLVSKLNEEYKFEKENQNEETDWLSQFKQENVWKIEDVSGNKEVTLSRRFGNEKINAIFSTDSLAEAEDMEYEDMPEDQEIDAPIGVSIIIEKDDTKGALEITTTAQGDTFYIDNVAYHDSVELAKDETAEGDWKRRGRFGGPVFNDLDESLVETFHKYIEERGFNQQLAEFISSYTVHKEQLEYAQWLKKVSSFVGK